MINKELTITQKQVLKVLGENENKWLKLNDIVKLSGVNRHHVVQAINFFMKNDIVYQPTTEGEVQISADGMSLYNNIFC